MDLRMVMISQWRIGMERLLVQVMWSSIALFLFTFLLSFFSFRSSFFLASFVNFETLLLFLLLSQNPPFSFFVSFYRAYTRIESMISRLLVMDLIQTNLPRLSFSPRSICHVWILKMEKFRHHFSLYGLEESSKIKRKSWFDFLYIYLHIYVGRSFEFAFTWELET